MTATHESTGLAGEYEANDLYVQRYPINPPHIWYTKNGKTFKQPN